MSLVSFSLVLEAHQSKGTLQKYKLLNGRTTFICTHRRVIGEVETAGENETELN